MLRVLTMENHRVGVKIGVIVLLFSIVSAGGLGHALWRLQATDDSYSSLIAHDERAATLFTAPAAAAWNSWPMPSLC